MSDLPNRNKFERKLTSSIAEYMGTINGELRSKKIRTSDAYWKTKSKDFASVIETPVRDIVTQSLKKHGADLKTKSGKALRDRLIADIVDDQTKSFHIFQLAQSRKIKDSLKGKKQTTDLIAMKADVIAGVAKSELLGRTIVTKANTMAAEGLADELNLKSPLDKWMTRPGYCSICSGVRKQPRKLWNKLGWRFENGPPAHPYCNCYIIYKNL